MKRVVPYPPLPKRKSRIPQAGLSLFFARYGGQSHRWPEGEKGLARTRLVTVAPSDLPTSR
jgi:hypothetical protein